MPTNITLNDLIPTIREVVNSGKEATFIPKGRSMQPMLRDGRDEIILVKPCFPLKKYDLPLYVRNNGTVVLHRVIKTLDNGEQTRYIMRGDNTWENELNIADENIVAVVARFKRGDKWRSVNSLSHKIYLRFWVFSYPCRKLGRFIWHFPPRAVRKILRIINKK